MDEPKRYDIPVEHCVGLMPSSAGKWLHRDDPAIVQAIAVRKACHEAGLLDEHGNLRKIVGTLPISKDGAVVGDGAVTYWYNKWIGFVVERKADFDHGFSMNYSAREAAERAAKGERGFHDADHGGSLGAAYAAWR